jgi:nicotinate-nucleotide pyrophosphorylase (carboxylating)
VETLLESSGNITLETIAGYARAGVDGASVGRLTHSVAALDLGLDLERR